MTSGLAHITMNSVRGVVLCFPILVQVNDKTHCHFDIAAAPSAPTITSLISTYSDQLTVTWTSVPTATSYNVSINASVNTLVPIPSIGAPQYSFTELTNNTVYTVSVVAINCAGSSSPATMTGRKGITSHIFTEMC